MPKQTVSVPGVSTALLGLLMGSLTGAVCAQPVATAWAVAGPDDTVAVAAAAVSGWYAAADSYEDSVEVRDVRQNLIATITRAQVQSLLPWMSLDGGQDGPCGLAFSDSGRVLYILVYDDTVPGDGLGSDAVLRYDVSTGTLGVFARLELANTAGAWPHLGVACSKGRLYVGTGNGGGIKVYTAGSGSVTGTLVGTSPLPAGVSVRGLAFDHDTGNLFAASELGIYRASTGSGVLPLTFSTVGPLAGIRSLTFADHYGPTNASRRGLYALRDGAAAPGVVLDFIPFTQAYGAGFSPAAYATSAGAWHSVAATADGRLLIGADEDALTLADGADDRLGFDAWVADEFAQVAAFSAGLISPDGEPAGWVIDADVSAGGTRFHPATPDGAAWVVFSLLANDRINHDPQAQGRVRAILTRYGGLAPDGIRASRSADGIFRHWIDPLTGGAKAGWDPEYATLSTMKMVAAAARAMAYYPDDAVIARAGSQIVFKTRNWGAYIQPGSDRLYFRGQAGGGADTSAVGYPYNEGIIFVEQAGVYGGAAAAYAHWIDRSAWPTAQYVPGRPITGASYTAFQSAFLSLYPLLLEADYRASAAWRTQVENLRWSSAAWTDDNAPKYFTVFSAGTTASQWGGYSADNLGSHPGNVTTFTSLEALCGAAAWTPGGGTPEAVAAYAAYRKGAREAFRTGASMLYRRSDVDRAYTPNSAGLPDVVLGGLGLGELLSPGLIDAVLAVPYPRTELCPVDLNADGAVDAEDLYRAAELGSDLNLDGVTDGADGRCAEAFVRRREASGMGAGR